MTTRQPQMLVQVTLTKSELVALLAAIRPDDPNLYDAFLKLSQGLISCDEQAAVREAINVICQDMPVQT